MFVLPLGWISKLFMLRNYITVWRFVLVAVCVCKWWHTSV